MWPIQRSGKPVDVKIVRKGEFVTLPVTIGHLETNEIELPLARPEKP